MNTRLSMLVLLLSAPLQAQQSLDYLLSLSLEQLMQIKVTSSTLTAEDLKTVPSSMSVFSQQELRHLGIDFLHELLNFVPGFQVSREGDHGVAYLYSPRGSETGAGSVDLLLLMDGQRISEVRTQSASRLTALLPLEQIERIEVIRGPGSAIYGSNAFLGVINIVTVSGLNEAGLQAGESGRGSAYMAFSNRLDEWDFNLFASGYRDDGDTYHVQDTFSSNRIETNDPWTNFNINAKLAYRDTLLRFLVMQDTSDNFYSNEKLSNGFNTEKHSIFNIGIEHKFSWLNVLSHVVLSKSRSLNKFKLQQTPAGALSGGASTPDSNEPLLGAVHFEGEMTGVEFKNDWLVDENNRFNFGLELRQEEMKVAEADTNFDLVQLINNDFPIDSFDGLSSSADLLILKSRDIIGVYSQYQYDIDHQTELTLGVRYDDYSNIGSSVSPRMGIVRDINDNNTVKLLYGSAFRAPSFSKLYFQNNPDAFNNPNLKPETVETWEIIWMGQWSNLFMSLGYFNNTIEDTVVPSFQNSIRVAVNGPTEHSDGVELEFISEISDDWLIRGNFTHFITLPDNAFREADKLASFIVNYNKSTWNLSFSGVYHSDREMIIGNEMESINEAFFFNTKLIYTVNNAIKTNFKIKNISDKHYGSAPQDDDLTESIPNRGREFSVGVVYSF